jgi:hypothetical protein
LSRSKANDDGLGERKIMEFLPHDIPLSEHSEDKMKHKNQQKNFPQ